MSIMYLKALKFFSSAKHNTIINEENVKKREQQLIYFKGFIPVDFLGYIDFSKRNDYIKEIGIFEKVQEDYHNFRVGSSKYGWEYKQKILKKFIGENPQFKDCVILE